MIAELIDFTAPTFQPGFETSMFDVAPIPLDGPTTLQLAIAAIVTLGVYALFRRYRRPQVMSTAGRLSTDDGAVSAPASRSRDAA